MNPHLRHTVGAAFFCTALFVGGFLLLFHASAAKSDPIADLLKLPAPPPPNPAVPQRSEIVHTADFFRADYPPADDARIEDLVEYWSRMSNGAYARNSRPTKPSDKVVERLIGAITDEPDNAYQLMRILPTDEHTVGAVKAAYDKLRNDGEETQYQNTSLRDWLKMNSPYFVADLEKVAEKTRDNNNHYIDTASEDNVLALTTQDWQRADPIVTRMYGDHSQPVTQILATWALYKHALETDSSSDIERYRSELMHTVEDRSLPDGVRDKANDALTHEKEWPGREDWTISLFDDDSLANMTSYTMLTTLMTYGPSDKYIDRLATLLEKTSKPTVRTAAIRSLVIALPKVEDPQAERHVVSAMLPWLEDPKWAGDVQNARRTVVQELGDIEMPEAVPALIKLLDEKNTVMLPDYEADMGTRMSSNVASNQIYNAILAANRAMANAANAVANARRSAPSGDAEPRMRSVEQYTYRASAVVALAKQRDQRALPALRRVMNTIEPYERQAVVHAIYQCGGFTTPEQVDAIDLVARAVLEGKTEPGNPYYGSNAAANSYAGGYVEPHAGPISPTDVRTILGHLLMADSEVPDELARAVVARIGDVEKQEPDLAEAYRKVVMRWPNSAVNILFLQDAKQGKASVEILLRLLGTRKELKEKQASDVFDVRTGVPSAIGIAACLLDDRTDADAILDSGSVATKAALMACARLTRLGLDVQKVQAHITAKEPLLAQAAEQYLVAEDSPAARSAVLARHPGEAMILGARQNFPGAGAGESYPNIWLYSVFFESSSNGVPFTPQGKDSYETPLNSTEKQLQDEVKKDDSLYGVYALDGNYIRIYKDRVVFSWDDDESRYYERQLSAGEFDEIKSLLASKRADEQAPFLFCQNAYCEGRELLMLGRNGGRRVYTGGPQKHKTESDLFSALDAYFERLKETDATLKYSLSREMPGLEIALADKDLHVETVWKNGDDLRVAAKLLSVRERVNDEVAKARRKAAADAEDADTPPDESDAPDPQSKVVDDIAAKRAFEGYSWHRIVNGADAGVVPQPNDVEYVPFTDSLPAQPTVDEWKARGAGFEIRSGDDGLYTIARGQATLLQKGNFDTTIVVTPNGRWAIVKQLGGDDEVAKLLRINLLTKRSYPVVTKVDGDGTYEPAAYIPSINRVLVVKQREYYGPDETVEQDEDDRTAEDDDPATLALLDPETGSVTEAKGEFRPLSQQLFRPLQRTSADGTYWAAMPDKDKHATSVGIYDGRNFAFHTLITVPKILFNSMDMWVDEPAGKLYFVYRGHLLSLPMKIVASPAAAPRPRVH